MKILFVVISLFSCIPALAQDATENKRVVTRYIEEVVNKQKLEVLREIYSEDYLFHNLQTGEEVKGLAQLNNFLSMFFKAFPDVHYTIDRIVAEGDQVVVQCTATGTQKADFFVYPVSNNKIRFSEVFFYTLKGGKIVANRGLVDMFQVDRQLKGIK
jgi:steroid delta-isomerase-like uncharacterized protein